MRKLNKMGRFIALALSVIMLFTACGKSNNNNGVKDTSGNSTNKEEGKKVETTTNDSYAVTEMEETTIKIRVMNEIKNIDSIIAEYKERVKDDPIMSKINLEFEYVPGADYKDKLAMSVTTQEDYDLMFCGSWHGFAEYANSNAFADLSKYFNNDNFPGLKAAFMEDIIDAAKTYKQNDDGTWTSALYRIPLLEQIYDLRGITYREDLRVKYNIPEITNDDILKQYLQTVLEKEENISYGMELYSGFFYWESKYFTGPKDGLYWNEPIGANNPFYIALSEDGKTVIDAVVAGDSKEHWDKLPEGYQYDFVSETYLEHVEWADLLNPVRGTTDTTTGYAAAGYSTLTGYLTSVKDLAVNEDLRAIWPDASLRFYPTEESQRNMEPGAIISEMVANNQLVVPEWSENIDAVMCFLNWMFGSQENHDLFQYGIEGVHWSTTSDTTYTLTELPDDQKYVMPGYSFCWNPTYVRISDELTAYPEILNWYNYMLDENSYTLSDIAGFTFNSTGLETEIANLTALSSQNLFHHAVYGDETSAKITEWHSAAEKAGLDKVRTALIEQLQAYLDMKITLE